MPQVSSKPVLLKTGLLHPELEQQLLRDIDRIKSYDPLSQAVILVGSLLLRQYLENKICQRRGAAFGIRFVTFADLARDLTFDQRVTDNRPRLPRYGIEAAGIISAGEYRGDNYYAPAAGHTGFKRAITSLFDEIDQTCIDFSLTARLAVNQAQNRWNTLVEMHRDRQRCLKPFRTHTDGFTPPSDPHAAFIKAYCTDRLLVYGFYDFTGLQLALIESLTPFVNLNIYMPYWAPGDDFGSAFKYANDMHGAILKDHPEAVLREHQDAADETGSFGRRLFRYSPVESARPFIPDNRKISISRADNISGEVNRIVGLINEKALFEGTRFCDVGILLWNPEAYLPLLREALNEAEIPFADMVGFQLADTPEARALLAMHKMAATKLKRSDLVDLLATYNLKLTGGNSVITPDTSQWEIFTIQAGIVEGSRHEWLQKLKRKKDELDRNLGITEPLRQKLTMQVIAFTDFINRLFDCLELIPTKGSFREFAAGMSGLLHEFLADTEARNHIINILDNIEEISDSFPAVSSDDFLHILTSAFRSVRLERGRFGSGVCIADKMSCRGVSFDLLFVPGMSQGSIPVSMREDVIIPDRDRIRINKLSNLDPAFGMQLKKKRREEERLLFALAVDSAVGQLCLSYPGFDTSSGKPNFPSRFLLEICRIMTGRPVTTDDLELLPFIEKHPEAVPGDKDKFLRRLYSSRRFVEKWLEANVGLAGRHYAAIPLYEAFHPGFRRLSEVHAARLQQDDYTPWDGILRSAEVPPEFRGSAFSITGLERYAECPFRYWLTSVLKAIPLDEPEPRVDIPPDITGGIVHAVLDKLYQKASQEAPESVRNRDYDWFASHLPEVLQSEIEIRMNILWAPPAVWSIFQQSLEFRLAEFLKADLAAGDGFIFKSGEEKISMPLEFENAAGTFTLNLSGRIDRIDQKNRLLRVIDYKTGRTVKKPDKLEGGQNLQLPLYLKALLTKYPESDQSGSCAEYLQIGIRGDIQRQVFSGDMLAEKREQINRIVDVITKSISSGIYPPIEDDNHCRACSVKPACFQDSRRKFAGGASNPFVDQLREIRGIS